MGRKTLTKDEEIQDLISSILNEAWVERDGQVVPRTNDVALKNGAVNIDATFLYADLAGSTELQKDYIKTFAAKAVRMYLAGASRIIREVGGSIRSFDGDRVMGVFVGPDRSNNAVRAAFAINWMVSQVINPLVKERHENNKTTVWVAKHGIGIDTGETFVARAGVRNSPNETSHNDLFFVGRPPNIAAKLSSIRDSAVGSIVITGDAYDLLADKNKKYLKSSSLVWSAEQSREVGPFKLPIRHTDYWRSLS